MDELKNSFNELGIAMEKLKNELVVVLDSLKVSDTKTDEGIREYFYGAFVAYDKLGRAIGREVDKE